MESGHRPCSLRWPRCILGPVVPKGRLDTSMELGVGWLPCFAANARPCVPNDLPNDKFSEQTSYLQNGNVCLNRLHMFFVMVNSIPPPALRFAKLPTTCLKPQLIFLMSPSGTLSGLTLDPSTSKLIPLLCCGPCSLLLPLDPFPLITL